MTSQGSRISVQVYSKKTGTRLWTSRMPVPEQSSCPVGKNSNEKCDTCDLVLFGDYMLPSHDWTGDIPLTPLAVCSAGANQEAFTVRIFAMSHSPGTKYWEMPGSVEHAEAISDDSWFPQIVADEIYERIERKGRDSVPQGEFIEEACNRFEESVLVVDAALLKQRHKAFRSILLAKRIMGSLCLRKFFFEYVRGFSTKAVALKFMTQGILLKQAHDTTSVSHYFPSASHTLVHEIAHLMFQITASSAIQITRSL